MLRHMRWALLWALFILLLCLLPGSDLPKWQWADLLNIDKLVHAGMFAVLVLLSWRGLKGRYGTLPVRSRRMVTVLAICMAYGGMLEIMQGSLLTERTADLNDFIANSVGCGVGWWWLRRRERPAAAAER